MPAWLQHRRLPQCVQSSAREGPLPALTRAQSAKRSFTAAVDLTQRAAGEQTADDRKAANEDISSLVGQNGTHTDAENGFASRGASSPASLIPHADGTASDGESVGSAHRRSVAVKAKDKAAQLLGTSSPAGSSSSTSDEQLPEKLAALVGSYDRSQVSAAVRAEIAGARAIGHGPHAGSSGPWGDQGDRGVTTGYKRASFLTQFRILSGRAFKNLYRCVCFVPAWPRAAADRLFG